MIIKTYLVRTLEEAEQLINREMGPDAVILTSRQIKPKGLKALFLPSRVEVTAAVEEKDWEAFQLLKGEAKNTLIGSEYIPEASLALFQEKAQAELTKNTFSPYISTPPPVERTNERLLENLHSLRNQVQNTANLLLNEPPLIATSPTYNPSTQLPKHLEIFSRKLWDRFGKRTTPLQEHTFAEKEHLQSSRRPEIEQIQTVANSLQAPFHKPEHIGGVPFLVSKGLLRPIAEKIDSSLYAHFGEIDRTLPSESQSDWLNALKKELADLVRTAGPLSLTAGEPTCVALVGPHGVGKTTTLLKLALQYQDALNKQVVILFLNQQRSGAQAQIHSLAETHHLNLVYATNAQELQRSVASHEQADLILIDTPSCSPYQWQSIDELADILSCIPKLHVYLTLSATTKDLDVYGAIHNFSRLNPESVIFTKLDETIAQGILINSCVQTGKPISYLTTGPHLPNDIKIADPEEIARAFLMQQNAPEFAAIRSQTPLE